MISPIGIVAVIGFGEGLGDVVRNFFGSVDQELDQRRVDAPARNRSTDGNADDVADLMGSAGGGGAEE